MAVKLKTKHLNGFVGEHGADHFCHIGSAHMGRLFAHEQHPALSLAGSDPGGKLRCLVGVAALDEIAQIADHLLT